MQIPHRSVVFGLVLAACATAVHAQAATPTATPLNLAPDPLKATPGPTAAAPAATVAPTDPLGLALPTSSDEVQRVTRWVLESGDNARLPYLVVDKVNARVYAFNPAGQLQASAPALLGLAQGDRLIAPNSATMEQMPPSVRITPAGRFVSRLAIDSHGNELLVLDYDASISLHPVVKGTPKERRAERLGSATSADNRISYGCINVPPEFYTKFVSAAFAHRKGIVYVLPEKSPAAQLFGFQPADMGAPATATAARTAAPVASGVAAQASTASIAPAAVSVPANAK